MLVAAILATKARVIRRKLGSNVGDETSEFEIEKDGSFEIAQERDDALDTPTAKRLQLSIEDLEVSIECPVEQTSLVPNSE